MIYDFAVVGGGIVGLATGLSLAKRVPGERLLILEKESGWAAHQSGHNSGVIHSGIYYKNGSLKSKLCREGNRSMVAFCREHAIAFEVCGKVIVAVEPWQLPLLDDLFERGRANGLDVAKISPEELKEIEPHAVGLAALKVPTTGIVDFAQVATRFAGLLGEKGADLRLNSRVEKISYKKDEMILDAGGRTYHARRLINCAGLHGDRLAALAGLRPPVQIVPFRGEYYELKPEKRYLVKNLIYPVPNPKFPFLGVHFTRGVNGEVHCGPNAVLGLKREGYAKTDFSLRDFAEVFTYTGFWKLAVKNLGEGTKEMVRSFSKAAFLRSLQRLIPEIEADDIFPAPAGVRAQAVAPDGRTVDDFLIVQGSNSVHILNAPSPAATASIEIGNYIAETAVKVLLPNAYAEADEKG